MGFWAPLTAIFESVGKILPYRREEYKYEYELRLSGSPVCHQREIKKRHPWMIWHTQVFVSHVVESGDITFREIK